MSEEILKQRGRLGSEALTEAEELPLQDISPLPTKPMDDPDAPPELELEEGNSQLFSYPKEINEIDLFSFDKPQTKRSRSKSEDNEFSILAFLDKKIRVRIMSEELTGKLSFDDPCE